MTSRTKVGAGRALLGALLALAASTPRAALAEGDHELAVRLFEEAGRAQDRGAYDEACPRFARVVELEPTKLGAKLALADCYEQAGKLASAAAAYRVAAARAVEVRDERGRQASQRVQDLEAKAPRLLIHVPGATAVLPGLVVLCDGAPLDASQWSRAVPFDPGDHTIYVGATGKKPWSGKVRLAPGATAQVVIGGLEDLPRAPALELPSPAPAPAPPPPVALPPSRGVPAWVWVTGALGLASGGAAVAFGVDQAITQQRFIDNCRNPPRDRGACDARSARLYRDFGLWIGLGAAGVAAFTAATVGIAASTRRPPASRSDPLRASLWITPEGWGATLGGRF